MHNLFAVLFLISIEVLLGSCSTFHTPVTREVFTKNPASIEKPEIEAYRNENFEWPVKEARMTRGFLPQKRKPHLGIDLASQRGTPILAAQEGTVVYAGREFKGYGRMVLIENGYGWATVYAHLDKFYVEEGSKVQQGTIIGAMGRTGHATGVHLHFEIRKNKGPVDPIPLLPAGEKLVSMSRRR